MLSVSTMPEVENRARDKNGGESTRKNSDHKIDVHGVKHYEIYGPLFFGSIELFNSKFDIVNDPDEVIINFKESRIMDQSAIECINKLSERYLKMNKRLHLRHLSFDCIKLIKKAEKICEVNILEDPDYFVAIDDFRKAQAALKTQ